MPCMQIHYSKIVCFIWFSWCCSSAKEPIRYTHAIADTNHFIEVNDGSCLSNMQCVLGSDAEGYELMIRIWLNHNWCFDMVQGVAATSQGSKQKVELWSRNLLC
ncbi:asparagine--tRNA ligase, chloroplastic/mitochondrial-like isoform X2 [Rosa rugosa]|uniref:asparagine--tRNA ligase, chloroplastic/mitochondrial-like isoform X2 n=1 Tax=Rosa rugosa TaxID=74645 RepID=UPI002B40A391|nr:asparagine--tRNA ligase, chloroplastic/mitochondrial-like isoform X2 [Rosa rugosa]